jgi:hypothetical protein
MAIRDVLSSATRGAISWVGNKLGVPSGVTEKVADLGGKLFEKSNTLKDYGDFDIIDTSVQPQSFGGRMGFVTPRMSYGSSRGAGSGMMNLKTQNAATLNAEWDYRLNQYFYKRRIIKQSLKA